MHRSTAAGLAAIVLIAAGAALSALRRTSTTFDEIVLVAAGARALATGDRSLILDQPPLMPLLYGAAARAAHPSFPSDPSAGRALTYDDRWNYARAFYFDAGNDPERIALWSRVVGVACLVGLILVVFAMTRRVAGERAALVAAALVAFLPDALAHAGVAYNDLPLALGFLLAVWALDAFVRRPGVAMGALAGAAAGTALGIKFSALALAPIALLLITMEGVARAREGAWWRSLASGSAVAVLAAWTVTAALYGGDPALVGLRLGYYMTVLHASQGHPAPAFALGLTSEHGWWWYFPVMGLLKTPVAFQLLTAAGAISLARAAALRRVRELLASRLRAPLAAVLVFGGFLLTSHLNAGFRYALPLLPPLVVLVAAGLARGAQPMRARARAALALLLVLHASSTLIAHPWYLSYASEWAGGRRRARELMLDSSLDWGQGLLALRDWMAERDVASVRLSYFGSALPAGYGIRYGALPSFLPLPQDPAGGAGAAEWTAISATNLKGLYLGASDPFAAYRAREPDALVGGSILLFREKAGPAAAP